MHSRLYTTILWPARIDNAIHQAHEAFQRWITRIFGKPLSKTGALPIGTFERATSYHHVRRGNRADCGLFRKARLVAPSPHVPPAETTGLALVDLAAVSLLFPAANQTPSVDLHLQRQHGLGVLRRQRPAYMSARRSAEISPWTLRRQSSGAEAFAPPCLGRDG